MRPNYTSGFFQFLLILLLTLNAFNSAKAEYVMTITGGEVPAQEGITIEILIDNAGDFTAFQVDIPIPEQFSYVEGSAVLNPDRIANHMLHADIIDGNVLRFICFSITNASFLGNTGSVASFELIAGTQPGDYELTPLNPIIGVAGGGNVITEAIAGVVTLLAPDIQVSPLLLNFGEIPLTTHHDKQVTLQNTGNQPLEISGISFDSPFFEVLEDDEFVLAPGNLQQLTIRFSSVEKGHYIQEMTISSNDPDEPEAVVDLEAIAFAVNELHCGNMLSFSGTRDTLTLSINNMEEFVAFQFDLHLPSPLSYVHGSATLTDRKTDHAIDADMISDNVLRVVAFSITNQPFSDEDGDIVSLAFDVFGTGGWYPLNLSNVIIADHLQNNVVSDFYNGSMQVAAPDIYANPNLNFGDVSVTEIGSEILTIHNWGTDTLFIDQLQTTNSDFFTEETTPIEVMVGQSIPLEVFFHNPEKGIAEGILRIFSNDPDENPYLVHLTASAFAPNYMIVPDVSAFMYDIIHVEVHVDNHESFVAFEFYLHFPSEVMTFLPDAEYTYLTDRAQDHQLVAGELEDGMLRVFAYSMWQNEFLGNSGAVVKLGFAVDAPETGLSYPLTLSNKILSNQYMENLIYAGVDGWLTIVEGEAFPEVLVLDEQIIGDDEQECFAASETIILAGEAGWFVVEQGGSAELVAGQNIIMLPGTTVQHGGHLLARIAQHEGDYCGIPRAIEIAKEHVASKEDVVSSDFLNETRKNSLFKLYPNPTDGTFTLELTTVELEQTITVEVHSMLGGQLLTKELPFQRLHTLSLEGQQPGMYIIRVMQGNKMGVERLIKR